MVRTTDRANLDVSHVQIDLDLYLSTFFFLVEELYLRHP